MSFAKILNDFRVFGSTLDSLASETQEVYSKLVKHRIFTEEQLKDIILSDRDRDRITALVVKPIKFIIFGDSLDLRIRLAGIFLGEHFDIESSINRTYRELYNICVKYDSAVNSCKEVSRKCFLPLLSQRASFPEAFGHHNILINGPFALLNFDVSIILLNFQNLDKTALSEIALSAFCIWLYAFRDKIQNENAVEFLQSILGMEMQLIEISWFTERSLEEQRNSKRLSKRSSKFYDVCELDPLGFTPLSAGFDLQNILFSYVLRAHHPLLQSQKQCLARFIDVLSLISSDQMKKENRLHFAIEKEYSLFRSLLALSDSKQREIANIVSDALIEVRKTVHAWLEDPASCNDCVNLYNCLEHNVFNQIQSFIINQLNFTIGDKIMDSTNVFKKNYILNLTRCLEDLDSLENRDSDESNNKSSATSALCQIISSVYNLDLDAFTCMNIFKLYLEKIRMILTLFTMEESHKPDVQWNKYADGLLNSISERRLARYVCKRLHDQVYASHNAFVRAINQLKQIQSSLSDDAKTNQRIVKKEFTPTVALLQLKTISLGFLIQYASMHFPEGKPEFGEELGRGRFGVVYACKCWGPYKNLALKTVVAVDENHMKDAAIEFHCNLIVPEHPRIIRFYGSIITKYRSEVSSTEQLIIIMQRLTRDLHSALEDGMPLKKRVLIAIQVIEGIRYLHRLGLVHRDIKLRNILLDASDNVKLTDMGFCKPDVLMDGSFVGTPVHMAPELFFSHYDNRIDIYAFGILLWHIASGRVEMPKSFSCFNSPVKLWEAVKNGLRPEKVPEIEKPLWNIAESCWQSDPNDRPSAAEVQQKLESYYKEI